MKVRKISIITPCLNAEKYIGETIESVINQTAVIKNRVELEYIICDGASTDRTLEVIKSYNSPFIKVISEKDNGMYEALAKGLKLSSGDIIAYINAGDFYSKYAFDVVLDIFEKKNVKWLHGIYIIYNHKSQIIRCWLPYKFRRRLILCGMYSIILPFIQQESVFWSRELNKFIDFEKLATFKYAGDYFLWHTFAKYADLDIVYSHLGGFKVVKGQLSSNINNYLKELKEIALPYKFTDIILALFDAVITYFAPLEIKKMLNKKVYVYNTYLDDWV